MPTAARLVGAVTLSGACGIMVLVLIAVYPNDGLEGDLPLLLGIFMGIGLVIGWLSLGARLSDPRNETSGFALGLRAAAACVFWILVMVGFLTMLDRIRDFSYREPTEAVLDIFNTAMIYTVYLMNWKVAGTAAVLGAMAGILTKRAAVLWR